MQTIIDKIKQKLRECDYKTGYLTLNECHAKQHGTELSLMGLVVVYDHLIDENKFYIT